MSHIHPSHVSHTNEADLAYRWVMSHTQGRGSRAIKGTHTHESCLTYTPVMSPVVSHMQMSHVPHTAESRLICKWVVSHIQLSHVSHANGSCSTYNWVMSLTLGRRSGTRQSTTFMSHVSHTNESCLTYKGVMSHIHPSHVSHTIESCLTYNVSHTIASCPTH